MITFADAFSELPLIAILRGVAPKTIIDVGQTLFDCGFRIIEIPLNSPDAFRSIELLSNRIGEQAVIGAGTVLKREDVEQVASAGGRLVVAPNLNPEVGRTARSANMTWCPGVMTPTEAFSALDQGASLLKLFPAELISPAGVSAMRAVLPDTAAVAVVGGVSPENMRTYSQSGADGFGLGSGLFKPDYDVAEIKERAFGYVDEAQRIRANP